MDDIFVDLFCHKLSEIKFLFWLWGIVIGFGGQVMRILISHQMKVMFFNFLDDL